MSINELTVHISKSPNTYIFKNTYLINRELPLISPDAEVLDLEYFNRFAIPRPPEGKGGDTVIINSAGAIEPFISFHGYAAFEEFLNTMELKYKHIAFVLTPKEMSIIAPSEEMIFIGIKDERAILKGVKNNNIYLSTIQGLCNGLSSGRSSVNSVMAILASGGNMTLSEIALDLNRKPGVAKVYLLRMLDAGLVLRDKNKRYSIPSEKYCLAVSGSGLEVMTPDIEDKMEKENEVSRHKSDFDYLN